jgi:hypothetical protein
MAILSSIFQNIFCKDTTFISFNFTKTEISLLPSYIFPLPSSQSLDSLTTKEWFPYEKNDKLLKPLLANQLNLLSKLTEFGR